VVQEKEKKKKKKKKKQTKETLIQKQDKSALPYNQPLFSYHTR